MRPGVTFTIEPILVRRSLSPLLLGDDWTVLNMDENNTAQYEETILINENGAEILTKHNMNVPCGEEDFATRAKN
jgi:methionyl aminopeptidase